MDDKWLPPAKRSKQEHCIESLETVDSKCDEPQALENSFSGLESRAESLGQLQFQVLDDVGLDNDNSGVTEADTSGDIECTMDESLLEDHRDPQKEEEFTKHKTVLDVKGEEHFEVLPLDWVMATHMSGMPVYLHKGLRVCTLARPYFLGKGSVRKHEIPLSAIPCLSYRRALDEEEKQKEVYQTFEEELDKTNVNKENCPLNSREAKDPSIKKVDYTKEITEDVYSDVTNRSEISSSEGPTKNEKHRSSSSGGSAMYEITHMSFGEHARNERVQSSSSGGPTNGDIDETSSGMPSHNEIDSSISSEGPTKNEMCLLVSEGSTQNEIVHSGGSTDDETAAREYIQETAVSDEGAKPPDMATPLGSKPVVLPGGLVLPSTRVVLDKWSNHTLTHEQVTEYCRKLFIFKDVSYKYFKCWSQRRQYLKDQKADQRPTLPVGPKLVTLALPDAIGESTAQGTGTGKAPRKWTLNMNERSYARMLYEYLTHVMHKPPKYVFRDLEAQISKTFWITDRLSMVEKCVPHQVIIKHITESSTTPFEATVLIDGIRYGIGAGGSKKQAKLNAAKETMLILVPEIKDQIEGGSTSKRQRVESNIEFFDMIDIEDPRVTDLCHTAMQPLPRVILNNCVRQNFTATGFKLQHKWTKMSYNKIEYHMSVGKHTATVTCKSKKMGKELASQALLKALHPYIKSYGSLLRLYGQQSNTGYKQDELELEEPDDRQPNYVLLEQLRREMENLGERDARSEPIGTVVISDYPSLSGSALNKLDL